jgi:hypothetical protein
MEDIARLIALRRAVHECQIAIPPALSSMKPLRQSGSSNVCKKVCRPTPARSLNSRRRHTPARVTSASLSATCFLQIRCWEMDPRLGCQPTLGVLHRLEGLLGDEAVHPIAQLGRNAAVPERLKSAKLISESYNC